MARPARSRKTPPTRLAPPPARGSAGGRTLPIVLRVVWWGAAALLIVYTGLSLERKITWYLAVDQFGYLTFAHDLLAGHVFHHWAPFDALQSAVPERTDVLAQTYIYDRGLMYCRYAPGFPMILATWIGLFGDDAAHLLNPTLFLVAMSLLMAFQWRAFGSPWRALAGVALLVLFPTLVHLWALTLTRDLAAHVTAFTGLFLLLPVRGRRLTPRRIILAGLALGFAPSIRPDALMYLGPAFLMAVARWRHEHAAGPDVGRMIAAGALGVTVGLLPVLSYNLAAKGNPFSPTQGMELQRFLSRATSPADPPIVVAQADRPDGRIGYPSPGWHGGTLTSVQGGGLQLSNLPQVLPRNLTMLRDAYGYVCVGLAIWGAMVAFMLHPIFFAAAVPYVVGAIFFYSCWARPDGRYLMGVHFFVPMLVVEGAVGTLDLVRRLAKLDMVENARLVGGVVAGALLLGAMVSPVPPGASALQTLVWLVPVIAAGGAAAAAAAPGRRVVRVVAPVLALLLVGVAVSRASDSLDRRASFQRPQVLAGQAAFGKVVPPGSVVITTEDIGRPAENIEYYGHGVHAVYLTDLLRWRLSPGAAARLFLNAGMTPYLLGPPGDPGWKLIVQNVSHWFNVTEVADIPPPRAIEYFVAASFHRGLPLKLQRVTWPQSKRPAS